MSLKPEDIPELTRLIELTTPSVKAFLRQALASIPKPIDPVPAAPAPSAPSDATPTSAAPPAPAGPSSKDITYIQPRYCFEQDNDNVTVLILDLPAFTPETKAGVVCNIQSDSLDIIIPPNRRLRLFPLEKPVNVPQSSFKVKKTQVEITLKKASKWEHWGDLVAKKSAVDKKKADADPSAGLMDLMKDLYNDGNDATRKIIAEAMQQSGKDRGKGGGMGDFGGGMGGGMGGGGMGGGAFGSGGDFGDSLDDDEAAL